MKKLFGGRIARSTFFIGTISVGIFVAILENYTSSTRQTPPLWQSLFLLVFTLALLVIYISVWVRRWHDLGINGWLAILAFVPIVNILAMVYLTFAKGDRQKNAYGKVPPAIHF